MCPVRAWWKRRRQDTRHDLDDRVESAVDRIYHVAAALQSEVEDIRKPRGDGT